ncbi:CPBP family intramembrane glutamic endopeptidase [Microbacterium sp. ZW T2_14]|uniref:CPBP family intramembrane glutamic endopeptidase n=1 Tax=Microbacterium sp. ZW T2_14 TaxID=3378079 RepID=UPI003851FFB7
MSAHTLGERAPAARAVVFVTIAFAISWSLWFLHPLVAQDQGIALTLDQLATFGPAVAALLVADRPAPTSGAHDQPPRLRVILAALATLAVTGLLLAPRWADVSSPLAAALLVLLIAIPATLVWISGSRDPRFATLLASILSPRSPWWTYLVALLLFPAASLLDSGLVALFGGEVGSQPRVLAEASWTGILIVFGVTLLFGGPLGEEIGWRGWLLPTLQSRLSPLLSSLIVGLVWGLWHLPLHLRGVYDGDMGTGLGGFAVRIASSCLLAVIFTWLYNRSRGGLLVVILLHTSVNNTSGYWLPVNIGLTIVLLAFAAGVVVADRMYLRPTPASHRRSTWIPV